MSEQTVNEHDLCASVAAHAANDPAGPMGGLAGEMVVSELEPAASFAEFPPAEFVCPHHRRFYIFPDADRVAALVALNGGGS